MSIEAEKKRLQNYLAEQINVFDGDKKRAQAHCASMIDAADHATFFETSGFQCTYKFLSRCPASGDTADLINDKP